MPNPIVVDSHGRIVDETSRNDLASSEHTIAVAVSCCFLQPTCHRIGIQVAKYANPMELSQVNLELGFVL